MSSTKSRFEGVLSRYFERLMQDDPVFATISAGISSQEGRLGSLSPRFHLIREHERRSILAALEDLSPRELSNEQQIDRLALRSKLLRECEDYGRGRHELEPNAPEHLFGILFHELRRGHDEPRRAAANLRSLLAQTPHFLQKSVKALGRPECVWVRVMNQTIAGGEILLKGVEEFLNKESPAGRDGNQITGALKALHRYRDRVHEMRLAPPGSFALGAAGLQRRVGDELGLDYTLGEIEALAVGEVNRIEALLAAACTRFGGRRTPERIMEDARREWNPDGPLLGLYESETKRIAGAFRKARAVTFPRNEKLQVRAVPEYLRTLIPTAAYTQPGAFAREQLGIFWVNDLSATKRTEKEKLEEKQQHFGIALTCAHEGYPGHHLQFIRANQHERKWRRLFAHAIFYEGWTLWCEQMMVDLEIDRSPWLRVQQLHDALWRCHRILVDLRLHTGRYSHKRAVKHLQTHLGFTEARADADVNWYTGQPSVPMSYWLGRLENERLRQRLMVGRRWSLQKFNDWLLSFGTVPQAWIEKYGLD